MFEVHRRLTQAGVLGMNRRNGDYLSIYNSRSAYPLVDNKILTKQLALSHGVNVPKLLGVLEYPSEVVRAFSTGQIAKGVGTEPVPLVEDFVLKPARGSGGEGIVVLGKRAKRGYRTVTGKILTADQLSYHSIGILNGMFSLGGHPDSVIVETRVIPDPVFERVSFAGVPDVRIIVFLGFPVMAMVRLPTHSSDGKANLHQGAVGAGISIGRGVTVAAVLGNKPVEEHPDTGMEVVGLAVPHWERLLGIAARCYEMTGLGYLGVDIVLDVVEGPLVLELNARPGLAIQIANQSGLLARLQRVESLLSQGGAKCEIPPEERLNRAREMFD